MSRNALVASLAGALALGLSAFSAQAASVPMSDAGIQNDSGSLVQKAHSRDDRHYRSNRSHRFNRYFGFQRDYSQRDHRANLSRQASSLVVTPAQLLS